MNVEHSDGAGVMADQAAQDSMRLVAAIAAGDPAAEREFVERYLPRVRALLLARSRNPDLAADLQQDVMIEALCALRQGSLRESSKLTPFVLAIARNVLNSHYRSSARRPESLEFPDDLPDLAPPSIDIEEQQRESLAMTAIASLELTDRSILQLTLVDGLKPGAIAERLRLNPDVVRQRKLRATRKVIDFVRNRSQKEFSIHSISGQRP